MIVETTANRLYEVFECQDIPHCWLGYPVKRVNSFSIGGSDRFIPTAAGARAIQRKRPELVRKEGCKVVQK